MVVIVQYVIIGVLILASCMYMVRAQCPYVWRSFCKRCAAACVSVCAPAWLRALGYRYLARTQQNKAGCPGCNACGQEEQASSGAMKKFSLSAWHEKSNDPR